MHTRRQFIQTSGAAMAVLGLGTNVIKAETMIGEARLTALSDGYLTLPGDLMYAPMPQDDLVKYLDAKGLPRERMQSPCNLTLFETGDRKILFDVGAGPDFQTSAGMLLDALDDADITPEDITDVVGH